MNISKGFPITLPLNSSKIWSALLLFFHICAMLAVFQTSLSWWLKASLLSIILLFLGIELKKYYLNPIILIRYKDGLWQLHTKKNVYQGVLCQDSFISRLFCVLEFQIQTSQHLKKMLVIMQDSMTREHYHALLRCIRLLSENCTATKL